MQPEREGRIPGEVEAVPAPEDGDKYVIVKRKNKVNEEGKEQQ